MRYRFVRSNREHYPIRLMCDLLKVSTSGYYSWLTRPESARAQANRALLAQMKQLHDAKRQTYGYPRMHRELRRHGLPCSRHRVARLMRQAGLRTRMTRLWQRSRRGRTCEHIEANRLQRQFNAASPNQRWVSDITCIPTAQGWLYVAAILDLYSRMIVGWSMAERSNKTLTLDALKMALFRRGKVNGLLLHSDQGMEYRTADYHALLKQNNITCSMSRKGNCLDNAVMESFFHTLKTEHTHHYHYKTREEAKQSIFEYIEVFYNQQRRHSYLNYMTPAEFEKYNV